jgi:hypothetical protein
MKPDFALLLSFEGIGLLARAAGGWRLAGEVRPDDPGLAARLAELRAIAVERGGAAFRTKLIIPNDQIRYLTVDTGHVSTTDRIARVAKALDGATPYAVEDLVYDICVDGPLTHVAAVARETLREAEGFAVEHKFSPVSFVAIPDEAAFMGEPFFGPTVFSEKALSPGARVEPDGVAVVVVGRLEDDVATPEPVAITPPEQAAPPAAEERPAPPVTQVAPEPAPEPQVTPEPGPAEDAAPSFSSRRTTSAPALGGAQRSTISPHIDDDEPEAPAPKAPPAPARQQPARIEPNWATRFLSRRKAEQDARTAPAPAPQPEPEEDSAPIPATAVGPAEVAAAPALAPMRRTVTAPTAPEFAAGDERERLTIFGMRPGTGTAATTPRRLPMGLILTAALLAFLMAVAAWAALFLDDGVAGLWGREPEVETVQVDADPVTDETALLTEPDAPEAAETDAPSALSDTDAAVLDALRTPEPAEPEEDPAPALPTVLDLETAEARYAVTGIWQRAPDPPDAAALVPLDDLYVTSIDPRIGSQDAVALADPASFARDLPLSQVSSPSAPGQVFAFGPGGLILPTPEGALSPDGFTVVLGPPPLTPPERPVQTALTPEPDPRIEISRLRPRLRPGDLAEQTERAQLGGLTREELGGVRPRLRPEVVRAEDEAQQEEDETPTAQAVARSLTPEARPANFARIIQRAERRQEAAPAPQQVAAAAPATVAPRIPSSASVARAATVNNAINLRRVNLIGVYGTPSNRRALVRMPNGRYRKVQVGDRLDGGRISAIGDNSLRYQKNGRNLVLEIPSG